MKNGKEYNLLKVTYENTDFETHTVFIMDYKPDDEMATPSPENPAVYIYTDKGPFSSHSFKFGAILENSVTDNSKILPFRNAPKDINYCDVNNFKPTSVYSSGYKFFPAENKTEVYATCDGEVILAGYCVLGGNSIIIKNGDEYATYEHLDDDIKVKKGDTVKAGQLIGFIGDTGYASEYGLGYVYGNTPVNLKLAKP